MPAPSSNQLSPRPPGRTNGSCCISALRGAAGATDRTDNGRAVLETYCKKQGGIPWIVILDAEGKALATSDGPKGNVGYPYEPEEIEHFIGMLRQSARKLNAAQIGQVEEALRKSRAEIER